MSVVAIAMLAIGILVAFFGAAWLFARAHPRQPGARRAGYASLPPLPTETPVARIALTADGLLLAFTADAVYAWDDTSGEWRPR